MKVREPRMDDNRTGVADNLRKISPSCVGSEKFFSTVVSYKKNIIFVSFTALNQRKLLLFFNLNTPAYNASALQTFHPKLCEASSAVQKKKEASQSLG